MIKLRPLLLAATLALLTGAIGQSDWTPITTKDGFLTLRFPAGWASLNQDPATLKRTVEDLKKNNPGLVNIFQNADDKDVMLQAYDLNDDPADGADNMNVKVSQNPGITDKDLGAVATEIMKQIPFKGKKEHKIVNMPAGKTLTYWGDMDAKVADKTIAMQIVGYMYLKADKIVICTFTTSNGKMAKLKDTFDKIMKTAKHS
jgi:hypothetical protein